ncbi:MAG: YHS domain-containing protein [bacterium]|nr:YHS domain-containing protein [bacterium]
MIIFSVIAFLGVISFAQEKPETEKKEKKECSHSCCGTKESKSEANLETNEDAAVVQIWNKVCPVEGSKVKSDSPSTEYNGMLIGFCCEDCTSKFIKNPETYLKNLNEDGSKFIKS